MGRGFNRLERGACRVYARTVAVTATNFEQLLDTLKRAGAALRDAEIPFALGGGIAIWAHGGPETEHDLDFFVKPEDAERALQALDRARLPAGEAARGLAVQGLGRRRARRPDLRARGDARSTTSCSGGRPSSR